MTHSLKALQRLMRCKTLVGQEITPQCLILNRYFSDKFDIKNITRSNRENSSLDGVTRKKSVKKAVKAMAQPVIKDLESDVEIPDCFSVLLEYPLYENEKSHKTEAVRKEKQLEFKQIIEEMGIQYLPSVSTVLKQTTSPKQREVLEKWKQRKTKELGGEAQFEEYQKGVFDKGSSLHKCIELKLQGETDIPISPGNEGHWKSVSPALKQVTDVFLTEDNILHQDLFYQGKFDCIANIRDKMSLIEWKTSSKVQPLLSLTYDTPLQVAAYLGAFNSSAKVKYNISTLTDAAVVFAYPTGEPATVHLMNENTCQLYWKMWCKRLFTYWVMQYQNSVKPSS